LPARFVRQMWREHAEPLRNVQTRPDDHLRLANLMGEVPKIKGLRVSAAETAGRWLSSRAIRRHGTYPR